MFHIKEASLLETEAHVLQLGLPWVRPGPEKPFHLHG